MLEYKILQHFSILNCFRISRDISRFPLFNARLAVRSEQLSRHEMFRSQTRFYTLTFYGEIRDTFVSLHCDKNSSIRLAVGRPAVVPISCIVIRV